MYIGKARENTDINNAKVIENACSIILTDNRIEEWCDSYDWEFDWDFQAFWTNKIKDIELSSKTTKDAWMEPVVETVFLEHLKELFPEGLPESKSKNYFKISFHLVRDSSGNLNKSITCTIVDESNVMNKYYIEDMTGSNEKYWMRFKIVEDGEDDEV